MGVESTGPIPTAAQIPHGSPVDARARRMPHVTADRDPPKAVGHHIFDFF